MTRLALLHSTVRAEEKLLAEAARARGADVRWVDIREAVLDPRRPVPEADVALERSVSTVKGGYAASFWEAAGVPVVNSPAVAAVCRDKFATSLALARAGVPEPRFALVFNLARAREVIEGWGGYPAVIKPAQGSWGRLLAKVNDEDGLEAVLEHKEVLGTPPQKAFYLQEYVRKPGRDIRAFVVDGRAVAAIYRESSHWITNTARGGRAGACPVTPGLEDICRRTSAAVGGGALAVDLFEAPGGLLVNEVNQTMEFRNSEGPTGVSIAGAVVEYALRLARDGRPER
ncbi:MAG TPA: lysine biosynthesis protein LysX [Candidatus Aminicenantes bacterium]|nr:lysine biosynthesis protein LysX [Candidatus Aminicenantes bacterium]